MLSTILWLVIVAVQAALAIVLTRNLGLNLGVLAQTVILIAFSGVGWLILYRLRSSEITWQNHVVGILMPWPSIVGGGTLTVFAVKNAIASIVFSWFVIAIDHLKVLSIPSHDAALEAPSFGSNLIFWGTVICWVVAAIAWVWVLRSTVANQMDVSSTIQSLRRVAIPLLLPPFIVVVSIVLRVNGYKVAALIAVAIPLLLASLPVLLMLAVVFYHYVIGKPMRWN